MKRYKMTGRLKYIGVEVQVPSAQAVEDDEGKWVKYKDVKTLLQSMLSLSSSYGDVTSQWVEDHDMCEVVPDPDFLKEAEKIPSLALDRVGDLLVNGVYCWRSNHVVYGAGCGNMLRVPQTEWEDFMTLMKTVGGHIQ